MIGESVVITCEAIAVPLPSYIINHNDTKVISSRKTYIITVLKYNYTGSYECIATNQLENSSKKFSSSVFGKIHVRLIYNNVNCSKYVIIGISMYLLYKVGYFTRVNGILFTEDSSFYLIVIYLGRMNGWRF